jgi:16S rRNA U516 pseudouridylate synthase RsuA-like enzyme
VEFNSAGFSGNIEKTIQVATNGIPRDYYLKLKGEVSGQALEGAQPGVTMDRVK